MIIDFHTHIGDFDFLVGPEKRRSTPITWDSLIARLDDEGIDKAVFLPIYASPDAIFSPDFVLGERMSIRDQVIDAARYSERIIPFGNLDPRWAARNGDFAPYLDWFQEHGCRGIGEITASLPCDDPLLIRMIQQIGERNWPVLFHATGFGPGTYGLQDDPGAPRLERLLQEAPDTTIIGHAQGVWAEIGPVASVKEKMGYPQGAISEEGALQRLLREYPNFYVDISAGSGFNALTRDPDYTPRFLDEFSDRLLFASDDNGEWPNAPLRQLSLLNDLLATGSLSPEAFDSITCRNALTLLGESEAESGN